MKINVSKLGIMHIRKKSIARGEVFYEVDGQVVPMVSMSR